MDAVASAVLTSSYAAAQAHVERAEQQPPPPPVCVMSAKVITVLNHKDNTNEIVMFTGLFHKKSTPLHSFTICIC